MSVYEPSIGDLIEGESYIFFLKKSKFNSKIFELATSNSYDAESVKSKVK
jgi:hypothetical protein